LSKNVLPPPKEVKRKSEHAGWGATLEELGEDPNYKQPKGLKLAAIEQKDDLSSSESDSDDSETEKDAIGELEGEAAAKAWTTFMQSKGKETDAEPHGLFPCADYSVADVGSLCEGRCSAHSLVRHNRTRLLTSHAGV
jgi:hypothetical protein